MLVVMEEPASLPFLSSLTFCLSLLSLLLSDFSGVVVTVPLPELFLSL